MPLRRGGGSIGELCLLLLWRGGSGRELTLPRRRRQGSPPIFTHQTESMIPQLTTASPMRKSRIAMMVSMEQLDYYPREAGKST
jgi:hypothetical protein